MQQNATNSHQCQSSSPMHLRQRAVTQKFPHTSAEQQNDYADEDMYNFAGVSDTNKVAGTKDEVETE